MARDQERDLDDFPHRPRVRPVARSSNRHSRIRTVVTDSLSAVAASVTAATIPPAAAGTAVDTTAATEEAAEAAEVIITPTLCRACPPQPCCKWGSNSAKQQQLPRARMRQRLWRPVGDRERRAVQRRPHSLHPPRHQVRRSSTLLPAVVPPCPPLRSCTRVSHSLMRTCANSRPHSDLLCPARMSCGAKDMRSKRQRKRQRQHQCPPVDRRRLAAAACRVMRPT